MDEATLRSQLCTACHQLWLRGLLVGDGGLVSVALHRRRFLTLPVGRRRADLQPDELICVDLGGDNVQHDDALASAVWHPHRLAYQHGIEREAGRGEGGGSAAPTHATALLTPVSLMALLRQEQSVIELPFAQMALAVVDDQNEAMLKSGLQTASAVVIRRQARLHGLLVTGLSLPAVLNLAERIEHAAAIELASPAKINIES